MDQDSEDTSDETLPVPADLAEALHQLRALGDATRASAIRRRQRTEREVLGCDLPALSDLAGAWRQGMDLPARLELAQGLWDSGSYEAQILAAKLLTQARIRPGDAEVWRMICNWSAEVDAPGIAEPLARAAERRLAAAPERLEQIEGWLGSDNPWLRRAALIFTLPWTRLPHPKEADQAILTRLLGWAERLSTDPDRLVQQALALWLRELSRRSPDTTRSFLLAHGRNLPVFARKEAAQLLAEPVAYPVEQVEPADDETTDTDAEDRPPTDDPLA